MIASIQRENHKILGTESCFFGQEEYGTIGVEPSGLEHRKAHKIVVLSRRAFTEAEAAELKMSKQERREERRSKF